MKKVKIIKSKSPSFWYANKIGEIFEVEDNLSNGFEINRTNSMNFITYWKALDPKGWAIEPEDCEICLEDLWIEEHLKSQNSRKSRLIRID